MKLGQVVMTATVNNAIADSSEFAKFVIKAMRMHASGLWGELDPEDKKLNDYASTHKERVLSSYPFPDSVKIDGEEKLWIITDDGHKVATLLFPSEY